MNPVALGTLLRGLRAGMQESMMSLASDSEIDNTEKGQLLSVLAMVHTAIEAAYQTPSRGVADTMPKLKSR